MAAPLLLVGCGKMGGALLKGWLKRAVPPQDITVVEPDAGALDPALTAAGVRLSPEAGALPADFRPAAVVLAVKPQVMAEVLPAYRPLGEAGGALFVSIAAGWTTAALAGHLGPGAAILRAMPNSPAAIGRGITVACPGPAVTPAQRALAEELLGAVGEVAWIEDEALMDAVTAVSGSGPAYVFLLVESLAEAGVEAGLAPALAMRLARATVIGSGALLEQTGLDPAALRENVTSPGGTTAAALEVLMAPEGLAALMARAVAAAQARCKALAD